MHTRVKAFIVDDERLARKNLRSMLAAHHHIDVVGEADSVPAAAEKIQTLGPDLIFLDIQMPGQNGFELLGRVSDDTKVIFVTAYDEHAIRAFEVNALDYLLKPVHPKRLAKALERVSQRGTTADEDLKKFEYDDRLFLTLDGRAVFLKIGQIDCICAAGPYSEIVTHAGKKGLVFKSMTEWEQRLPPQNFVRIHRSTIINFDSVTRVEMDANGSYSVHLRNHSEPLDMSRRYASKLKGLLK